MTSAPRGNREEVDTPMIVSEYREFVRSTDQSAGRPEETRLDIAIYGLVSEIGSVVAAIKKKLLGEGGAEGVGAANAEIVEELGDVVWYLFAVAEAQNPGGSFDVFEHDIGNLRAEVGAGNARADRIGDVLGLGKRDEFLAASEGFDHNGGTMVFEDYQRTAFLTARTTGRTLVEVCLAVLWQLSAELLRRNLPAVERELNKGVADREPNRVLGEIAWHVAALASVYGLNLSHIARENVKKVLFRADRHNPTPLHDEACRAEEQFPRRFEIGFVTVSPGRARMYLDGRRLGDELTDNAYEDDGYRFHDVMHLASLAKLGWSPVIRKLMGRKRRSDPKKDEVEDGARAQIVEEAVIKAIHSEGTRLARMSGASSGAGPVHLFPDRSDVTFRFLKFIHDFVVGLEVHANRYWEWEDAIHEGYTLYDQLRREGQGTITIDLRERTTAFRPTVVIAAPGKVAGLGSAFHDGNAVRGTAPVDPSSSRGPDPDPAPTEEPRIAVQRMAILDALGIRRPTPQQLAALSIVEVAGEGISVRATGDVQQAMWDRRAVTCRTTVTSAGPEGYYCTAIVVSDD